MADNKRVVDRLLGEVSYKGDIYKNALPVAYTLVNRAKATRASLESVTSPQSQVNAQKPAPGAEKYRATVEKALKDALSGAVPDPTKGATFYATPATFKNLPSGLKKTVTIGGHTFATDPKNRPLVTADGVKKVTPLGPAPITEYFGHPSQKRPDVPTPTAQPSQAERTMADAFAPAPAQVDMNPGPRSVKTSSLGPDTRDVAEQSFGQPNLSPQELINRAFGVVDANPVADRVASAWDQVPGDGRSDLVSMVGGSPAIRDGYSPTPSPAPDPRELIDAAWSQIPSRPTIADAAPNPVQPSYFEAPVASKANWDMPTDIVQAAARAKEAFGSPAPSPSNMLPSTRESGAALGTSQTLRPTPVSDYSAPSPRSKPESVSNAFASVGPTSRPNNRPSSSSYGSEDAGSRDVVSSRDDNSVFGNSTTATYSPTVNPLQSQRRSVQQYEDQVSYVDVANPAYNPGVPSAEIIDQMMNLPLDMNPAFPEPLAQAVPQTIRKKVVTKVPSGYKTYSAPKAKQPTLSRSQEQTYGKSGYAPGQTWRDTGDGGARNFSPTTSNYRNTGGSNAGSKSKNQSTGKGGSFSTFRAIANKVKSDFGGGSSSGGGKIVCTAMNEAYGFGGFRNAIWLRYARDHLTPEHQVGYHAIFRPLVSIAYHPQTSAARLALRSALEHIARARTADVWAEMRGSPRHVRGRAYRAILEPLCYLVGWLKSR